MELPSCLWLSAQETLDWDCYSYDDRLALMINHSFPRHVNLSALSPMLVALFLISKKRKKTKNLHLFIFIFDKYCHIKI